MSKEYIRTIGNSKFVVANPDSWPEPETSKEPPYKSIGLMTEIKITRPNYTLMRLREEMWGPGFIHMNFD